MVDLPIRSNKTSKKRFRKNDVGPYVLFRCVDQLVKKRRFLFFRCFIQPGSNTSYAAIFTGSQRQRPVETWKWSWPLRDWLAFQQCASLVWARVKEAKINPTTLWIIDICDYIYRHIYVYISWQFLEIGRTTRTQSSTSKETTDFGIQQFPFLLKTSLCLFLSRFVLCMNALRANLYHDADDESPTERDMKEGCLKYDRQEESLSAYHLSVPLFLKSYQSLVVESWARWIWLLLTRHSIG